MLHRTALSFLSLVLFCALSLVLKENYPISHFPMYGNPSDDVYYHWLADAEGNALPIVSLTGKTAAKLGKMLRSYTQDRAKVLKLERKELPQTEVDAVCRELMTYLRKEAAAARQALPARLAIMRTTIHYQEGSLKEETQTVFAE
jgi:hypothetical protein